MQIQWYRSATVGIFSQSGASILCDPWITDGAFIGSWHHWPPLEGFEFEDLSNRKWDALYISHIHADHFDRKLVAAIIRKSPELKIFIPSFEKKWLKRAVINCGIDSSNVIELDNNKTISFKDFILKGFTADFCDHKVCGVSLPCMNILPRSRSIDSLCLIEADGKKILNANDALAISSVNNLWQLIGDVDLLLGHYGGAGPFPQSFPDIGVDEKKELAGKTAMQFVNRLKNAAIKLNAKYVFPYAGQYVLGGRLHELNEYRSILPLEKVMEEIKNIQMTPISLLPYGIFDLNKETADRVWEEPSAEEYRKYLGKIKWKLFPYEARDEIWLNGEAELDKAINNVKIEFDNLVKNGIKGSKSSIVIECEEFKRILNFDSEKIWITKNQPLFENLTSLKLDHRLLRRIISRREDYKGFTQYHFNQAEIGSHIEWRRHGNYASETNLLNFLQTN